MRNGTAAHLAEVNRGAVLPPLAADWSKQVRAALMDVYTARYQPAEPRSHMLLPLNAPPNSSKQRFFIF